MNVPFTQQKLKKQNIFQKLTRRSNDRNAFIEVNNLLAKQGPLNTTSEQIREIEQRYDLDIGRVFPEGVEKLFTNYLVFCLREKQMSGDELRGLSHLKKVLGLTDREVKAILRAASNLVYHKELPRTLEDVHIEDADRSFLISLQEDLLLPNSIVESINHRSPTERFHLLVSGEGLEGSLSKKEEQDLLYIADNLNVEISVEKPNRELYELFALFWQVENGHLPEFTPTIRLSRNETCHFCVDVSWYERQKGELPVDIGGPTFRIKMTKGVYWRLKDLAVYDTAGRGWSLPFEGTLHITSRRLLLRASNGKKSFPLKRILHVIPYRNGLTIQNSSAKTYFAKFENKPEIGAVILHRLLLPRHI
jgi:hypothetical protein